MQPKLTPVILSGGAGTRLWPLSRQTYPKQFLPLIGDESLLKLTAKRFQDSARFEAPIVIANDTHRFLIAQQLLEVGIEPAALILEPIGRNTAPAAAIAALKVAEMHGADAIVGIFASDHVIKDGAAYSDALDTAVRAAQAGRIVCFGATPDRPETGYGYIEAGDPIGALEGVAEIAAFVEKPDHATAEAYLASGRHHWNTGMFIARADVLIAAFETLAPEVLAAARQSLKNATPDLGFTRLEQAALETCPALPFDIAVMEKTDRGAVIAAAFGWSDLGGFPALRDEADQDADGTALIGSALAQDCKGSYLRGEDGMLVAGLGLEGMAVVATSDAVLAAPLSRADEIKDLVNALGKAGHSQRDTHRKVYRPWGSYEDIDVTPRFRVKRIVVNPGARLSLQRHKHRSEHWIVVEGEATVTIGEAVETLTRNQSTYVPVGETHRLENRREEPLHMIEVQVGDYVGEDDIERLEDVYGRAPR